VRVREIRRERVGIGVGGQGGNRVWVGLRLRRQYDSRRTFISLSQADGARKDILRWVTHGATGDIVDLYTTLPWHALCAEVEKLRIELREGRVLEFPKVAAVGCDSPCDGGFAANEKAPRKLARGPSFSELRGLDLNQRPSGYESRVAHRADGRRCWILPQPQGLVRSTQSTRVHRN